MPIIYLKNPTDLVDHIKNNPNSLVVVDFFADWCGPCKMIGKLFEQELIPTYGDKLILIKVDASNSALDSLSDQFQVRGIPRLIFYHNKKIVDDVTGADKSVIETICKTYCK